MLKNTVYIFCKNNRWKKQVEKECGSNLVRNRVQLIEIIDHAESSINKAFVQILQANKCHRPFVVISPDTTEKQKAHIKKICKKMKVFDDVCAVIFTSGSTGNPKPIQWTNQMLIRVAKEKVRFYKLKKGDRVANFNLASGIRGLTEFLMCCFSGVDYIYIDRSKGYEGIIEQIIEKKISFFSTTPSHWEKIAGILEKKNLYLNLSAWIGGANLNEKLILRLSQRVKNIYTAYGMTEAFAAHGINMYKKGKGVSVGRPYKDARFSVVSERGKECPCFESGEIVVSGKIVSPSCENPYYTGDIGYKDKEGDLFIIGRKDEQMKVGGYRINASQYINTYNKYRAGVFSLFNRQTGWDDVAIIFESGESLEKIKDYVNEIAPPVSQYCQPRWVFAVKKLPLTLTDKIDTQKIKNIFISKIKKLEISFKEDGLETDSEALKKIAARIRVIWQKLLKNKSIKLDNNFFALGGNSLKAVQTVSQINKQFKINMSIADMFDNPTIKKLTLLIAGVKK